MRELLLLDFRGTRYGVWRDDVISTKELKNIHQLPLTPACFAGVSVLDGSTVSFFDLGVCIGFPPLSRKRPVHILLMSEENQSAGLAVEGEIRHISIPSDAVFPMPDYLKTPAIETCAIHEGEAVPVINVSFIHSSKRKGELEPLVSEFFVSGTAQAEELSCVKDVRVFRTGGETFAVTVSGISEVSIRPEPVSRLTLTPPYVKGIVFHRDRVLPVIALSQRLKLPPSGAQEVMLVANLGGAEFGFLVDSDEVTLSGEDFTLIPLPPLERSEWMKSAVLRKGEIIPLIHFPALMSGHQDETPLCERYRPRSRFSSLFGKKPVEVREFLLLGMRYCLPNSQVERVIDLLPWKRLPETTPVVVGAAEHKGELLPVLDLAVWLGTSSSVTPDWKMMLVKNGNFRALVLTEAVFTKRRLPSEMHRALPIALPHKYVYGCYPDDDAVRIILNVVAMAVHFDKSAVRDFLSIISREGAELPEEVIPAPPGSEAREELSTQQAKILAASDAPEPQAPQTESVSEEHKPDRAGRDISATEPEGVEGEQESAAVSVSAPEPDSDAVTLETPVSPVDEPASDEAAEETASEAIAGDVSEKQGPVETVLTERLVETPAGKESGAFEDSGAGGRTVIRPPGGYAEVTSARRGKPALVYAAIATVLIAMLYFSGVFVSEESGPGIDMVVKKRPPETLVKEKAPSMSVSPGNNQQIEPAKPVKPQGPGPDIDTTVKKRPPEMAVKQETASVTIPFAQDQTSQLVKPVKPQESVSALSQMHEVKKGDTLWDISECYTGDPFNYPLIAADNRIQNPDFILLGQRIVINPAGNAKDKKR